jgi:hypothetical protein
MSLRVLPLVLAFSLIGAAGAAETPPEVESVIGRFRLHEAEAQAKSAQMERARAKGLIAGDSWAPLLDPSPIDVTNYAIRLVLDFHREVVSGSVELDFTAVEPDITSVELDAWSGLRILGVTLLHDPAFAFDSPVELHFVHSGDSLSFDLPRPLENGESMRILISYGGRAGNEGNGINWDYHGNSQRVAWTMAEPFGARVWWPCNDRPDDKAIVEITVTAPSEYTVASNGLMHDTIDQGDGTTTTTWSSIYPVASYLVVMNVADYVVSEETYVSGDGATMPVAVFAFPEIADQAQDDLAITPDMIGTMAEHFGEYPFIDEKYGNCTANFGGGMEHQTLTTISASAIGTSWMPWLNVHELGHQWWGDWVTCADWRELWLNEGFATLTEWLWAEHLGQSTLQDYLERSDQLGLFLGAVYDNPVPFSGTVYDKGAWVLRMLRQRLGDEDFFEGITNYRQAFPGGAATSEDLRAAFEAVSGRDLEQFFSQWVYGENRPRFRYTWEAIDGPALRLVIEQIQQNAGLFQMPLDVRVTTASGIEDHQIDLNAVAEQTFDIPLAAQATDIELDPERWSLFLAVGPNDPDLDLGPNYPGPFDAGLGTTTSPATLIIPLTNTGGVPLEITAWGFTSGASSDFKITAPSDLPLTVQPGATVDLQITFRSSGLDTRSSWLWIVSNDPDTDGVTYARVQGHGGVIPGTYVRTPSSVNFGRVPIFGVSEESFSLTNLGEDPVTLAATVEGDAFSLLTPVPPVSEGGTLRSYLVRFSPETVGDFEGNLIFETDIPDKPTIEVRLRGTGSSAPHIQVTPTALSLGIVGDDSTEIPLRISNDGTEDLVLKEFLFEGPFTTPESGMEPITIGPNESTELPVICSQTNAGPLEGSLRIRSNDPSLPWATVPLRAYSVDVPPGQEDLLAIPASASTAGLGGGWWSTNLILLNTGQTDAAADLVFGTDGARQSAGIDRTVTIPARTQRSLADVVASLGHEGAGGITIKSSSPGIVVTTRTAARIESWTFGQAIGPVRWGDAQSGPTTAVLSGLASGEGFHTNFGFFNLGDHATTVTFEVFAASGESLGTIDLTAQGGGYIQNTDALSGFGELRGAWARVSSTETRDLFTAFASVVDDFSHDPTFISPTLLDSAVAELVIPTVAAQPGFNGTRWATELTLANPGDADAEVEMTFHSADGTWSRVEARTISSGTALFAPDLLGEIFDIEEGAGWLEIRSSEALVTGCRIFNNSAEGTFGQFVPSTAIPTQGPNGALVIPGLRSDQGFRTNLGLTSLSDIDTMVELTAFSEEGVSLGTEMISLPAGTFVQVVKILDRLFDFEGAAWVEIRAEDPEVILVAHASVIDGSTGDPSFIPAVE